MGDIYGLCCVCFTVLKRRFGYLRSDSDKSSCRLEEGPVLGEAIRPDASGTMQVSEGCCVVYQTLNGGGGNIFFKNFSHLQTV